MGLGGSLRTLQVGCRAHGHEDVGSNGLFGAKVLEFLFARNWNFFAPFPLSPRRC